MDLNKQIPKEVISIVTTLKEGGFEAYLVGGCTRDLIMKRPPKDWDVATSATPEEIISLFKETFYENDYGTVGVVSENLDKTDPAYVVEVTPYRLESNYSDGRRPDKVTFSKSLEDDLKRRDFTINAIAYDIDKGHFIDPHQGQTDIKDRKVRTVGNPDERFVEDGLRILRAIRIASEICFTINIDTENAIKNDAGMLEKISAERIRDEFSRIVDSPNPMEALNICSKLGVLQYVVPELEKGLGVKQNGDHIYDVWEHNLRALQHAANKEYPFHVKLAALFHDIAKPHTANWLKEKNDWTFYGHDVVGARVSREIMNRLKYPKDITEQVRKLVRYHLFFTDIDQITLSAVRRIVKNVGPDLVWDLMKVRTCDRIGMGRPKETPYRLRKYESMIEEAMRAPVSVGMLKIDGTKIMDVSREKPGPRVGWVLHALLEEALDNPDINTTEQLEARVLELTKLSDADLKALGEKGKEKKDEKEATEVGEIRKRHWVK